MKFKASINPGVIGLGILLSAFSLCSQAYAADDEFIVIVNRDGPLGGADMGVVRDIYLGEKTFEGDLRVRPVNCSESPLKDSFLKTALGMSSKQYKRHWLKKNFQGERSIPSLGSHVDIVEFVLKEKGSVAYLPAAWAETINSGIPRSLEKVIIIGP